jgi:anaerobic ribonucleoside-triphosphate reductase activating protein
MMYYGTIKKNDIANGEGVRTTLFVSGCRNKCKNCFNPETWSFTYGEPFTEEVAERILATFNSSFVTGMTILGGEPMEAENQRDLLPFLRRVRDAYPTKTIWIYSGFTYEELHDPACRARCEATDGILSLIDVLVDGRYVEEKRNISLRFRGSENQRLIDVPKTIEHGSVILWGE